MMPLASMLINWVGNAPHTNLQAPLVRSLLDHVTECSGVTAAEHILHAEGVPQSFSLG